MNKWREAKIALGVTTSELSSALENPFVGKIERGEICAQVEDENRLLLLTLPSDSMAEDIARSMRFQYDEKLKRIIARRGELKRKLAEKKELSVEPEPSPFTPSGRELEYLSNFAPNKKTADLMLAKADGETSKESAIRCGCTTSSIYQTLKKGCRIAVGNAKILRMSVENGVDPFHVPGGKFARRGKSADAFWAT